MFFRDMKRYPQGRISNGTIYKNDSLEFGELMSPLSLSTTQRYVHPVQQAQPPLTGSVGPSTSASAAVPPVGTSPNVATATVSPVASPTTGAPAPAVSANNHQQNRMRKLSNRLNKRQGAMDNKDQWQMAQHINEAIYGSNLDPALKDKLSQMHDDPEGSMELIYKSGLPQEEKDAIANAYGLNPKAPVTFPTPGVTTPGARPPVPNTVVPTNAPPPQAQPWWRRSGLKPAQPPQTAAPVAAPVPGLMNYPGQQPPSTYYNTLSGRG